jgi:hypothetical protein
MQYWNNLKDFPKKANPAQTNPVCAPPTAWRSYRALYENPEITVHFAEARNWNRKWKHNWISHITIFWDKMLHSLVLTNVSEKTAASICVT